jgi:dethiobiotin synthetase
MHVELSDERRQVPKLELTRIGSFFVAGTDAGVGKTLVASTLVHVLSQRGLRVVGMKPVALGATWDHGRWHNAEVDQLAAVGSFSLPPAALAPYLLPLAVAPHIAAELSGVTLVPDAMLEAYAALATWADVVAVEGVGGFRVPLTLDYDTADLAKALALPIVLVVGLRLGCLNHALLTTEAIRSRGLRLAGWIANQVDPDMAHVERNFATLRRLLPAPCLGSVPWLDSPQASIAAKHLATDALLAALGAADTA